MLYEVITLNIQRTDVAVAFFGEKVMLLRIGTDSVQYNWIDLLVLERRLETQIHKRSYNFV